MNTTNQPRSYNGTERPRFTPFPGITRTTSVRLYQQGQVRTLADIAMTLNDQHHYVDLESFMRDFDDVIKAYRERGTVSYEICKMVEALIRNNEASLFTNNGYLDFDRLIEMVDHLSASDESNPLEVIYSRREKTKMLAIHTNAMSYELHFGSQSFHKQVCSPSVPLHTNQQNSLS